MCEPEQQFTTIVAPRAALRCLVESWYELDVAHDLELPRPEEAALAEAHPSFDDDLAPGVARVRHESRPTGTAARLQAEVLVRHPGVLVEPGFLLSLCAAPAGGAAAGAPAVSLDPAAVSAASHGPLPPAASGARVAVLDTGYAAGVQGPGMLDLLRGQPVRLGRAVDDNGHGTGIVDLITAVAAGRGVSVTVEPVRVVTARLTSSYELLCGMAYALWSGQFDVVNASLSADVPGGCPTMLGTSMSYVLALTQGGSRPVPVIVAAAGNTTSKQRYGYPARLSGAVVVQAWDSAGNSASYNVSLPPGVNPVWATGGDGAQPFGTISRAGLVTDMFGTSHAAAVVTGHLVS